MTDMQPKKMIILDILDILRKHTDEEHKLSQQQIQNLMESEYEMRVDRKTVRRNLSKLMEFGFPIKYRGSDFDDDAIIRNSKLGQEICEQFLKGEYQYFMACHVDKKHTHLHVVFNNTNCIDGRTFETHENRHTTKQDHSFQKFMNITDEICRIIKRFEEIKACVMDAGYKTPWICCHCISGA